MLPKEKSQKWLDAVNLRIAEIDMITELDETVDHDRLAQMQNEAWELGIVSEQLEFLIDKSRKEILFYINKTNKKALKQIKKAFKHPELISEVLEQDLLRQREILWKKREIAHCVLRTPMTPIHSALNKIFPSFDYKYYVKK